MTNDIEFEALLDQVENGSTFEALRAATQLNRLSRQRRKSTDELLREAATAAVDAARENGSVDFDEIVRGVKQRAAK
jgi:hypothetical protein